MSWVSSWVVFMDILCFVFAFTIVGFILSLSRAKAPLRLPWAQGATFSTTTIIIIESWLASWITEAEVLLPWANELKQNSD